LIIARAFTETINEGRALEACRIEFNDCFSSRKRFSQTPRFLNFFGERTERQAHGLDCTRRAASLRRFRHNWRVGGLAAGQIASWAVGRRGGTRLVRTFSIAGKQRTESV